MASGHRWPLRGNQPWGFSEGPQEFFSRACFTNNEFVEARVELTNMLLDVQSQ